MGKVIVSGGCRASLDLQAGNLGIGTTVKLMENNVATDFIVVQQGLPGSMYDSSCDGTWLLRRETKEERQWNDTKDNTYSISKINTWLNGKYFNTFGATEQSVIKQVKIPYVNGNGRDGSVASGANGISCKVFLLSGYELGWTKIIYERFPEDGTKLSYFEFGTAETANNKRIANTGSSVAAWWLRSPTTYNDEDIWYVTSRGSYDTFYATYLLDVRPCLIIPSTSRFDRNTLLLKG